MNRGRRPLGTLLTTAALVAALWLALGDRVLTHWAYAVERGRINANAKELEDHQDLPSLQAVSNAFQSVARIARPGVVNINVSGGRMAQMDPGELQKLRERLGDTLSEEQLQQLLRHQQPPGSGSGIVFDDEGHILTNNHVVGGRTDITVQLDDDRSFDAHLVGTDDKTDLAVIKIKATDLHPLKFADSDKVQVGEWVVAVGAPFGLSHTVTHGIISATGRTNITGISIRYQNFIQTDAAINPGNSGGPLLNLRGEVVGVNTAIATNGDAYNAGVAFTIPSNTAVKIAKQLIAHGSVARGWLGVQFSKYALTDDDVDVFKLPSPRGVLLDQILDKSPAEKVGLQVEDVITKLNGEMVRNGDEFRGAIADLGPDENITLEIIRDGKKKEVKLQLALQPATRELEDLATPSERPEGRDVAALGIKGWSFRPTLRKEIPIARSYDETERGVFVSSIDKEDRKLKIAAGELIVECEGKPVGSVGELVAAIQQAGDKPSIRLQVVEPNGDRRIIQVKKRGGS